VRGPSSDEAERLLQDLPDFKVVGLLHGASNYTFLARLGPYEEPSGLQAVYKPARGESPLWDFDAGTLYKREVAAYELSKVLGWPRIPPTVARRKAPHGVGAVQLFIEADRRHFLGANSAPPETWMRVALFDVIANHGLTFHTDHKLRTVIWDFAGRELPADLCGDVERTLTELERGELREKLAGLLEPIEIRALGRRMRAVIDGRWRFPDATSAWSIPWPPV
jgi:hypothetical protein